ncbi:MAG: hypothetical protein PUB51_02605 [Oscillospiraceae bacterium]|nr:hypothetical protein [Oscillospiraceae bacterium]
MLKKLLKGLSAILLAVFFSAALAIPAFAGTADVTYYNVGCLTQSETVGTAGLDKGDVIVMYPSDDQFYVKTTAENLVISGAVSIVAVPGVGSSSTGAAAFAKHIAKIKNQPVAAIVVGYGDGSIYTEGPQGYYIGRPSNVAGVYYEEPASQKLVDLYAAGAQPELLVGHSKGNMDIANALFKMYNEGHQSWYQGVTFKTFGCGVNVPLGLGCFAQYIGTLDSVGYSNTVSWRNMTYVYGRYHTTNPFYAATYMPIQNYL